MTLRNYWNNFLFSKVGRYFLVTLTVWKDARSISASEESLITALNNFDHRCL